MHDTAARFLAVAHGTASLAGTATLLELRDALRAARPDVALDLCFLDVRGPRLADLLDDRPTVIVPLLLSTGYHVRSDIPAVAARQPRARVARHLGPHPLLAEALADRLAALPAGTGRPVLVGAGSRRPEAAAELAEAGRLLAERIAQPVPVQAVGAGLDAALRAAAPVRVATYLLAEGQFLDGIRTAVRGRGVASAPLGAHPAVVTLAWRRYADALAEPAG